LPLRCRFEITQMSPPCTEEQSEKRPARGLFLSGAVLLVCLGVVALLLASGSTSIAWEPGTSAGSQEAGVGSQAWIAGWVVVFLALSALYSFERRRRAAEAFPATLQAAGGEGRAAERTRRPIEVLLKKKPAASAEEPPRPSRIPRPTPTPPEDATPPKRRSGRGVKESSEESFSVADWGNPGPAAAPARTAEAAPPAVLSKPSRLERCASLRVEGRFDEAARVAREGLAADDDLGPLLIELSRAELGIGRVQAAIEIARDAHFACRSRESAMHLIRLLTETRRLTPADGPTLRRAAARHPGQALLRHAAGVFESMHGEPAAAEQELRAALRLATDAALRAAIERDLARVRALAHAGGARRP
jgi:hypothetical protein